MDTRGYSEAQIKAKNTIISLMGEYFGHGILVVKDSRKTFYWECVGDDDLCEMLSYKAWEEITEDSGGVLFDDEEEVDSLEDSDYLEEERRQYEDDDEYE